MKKALIIGATCVLLFAAAATYVFADTVLYPSAAGSNTTTGSLTATVTVNPKITLELTTPDPAQTVNFGAIDPLTPVSKPVDIRVQSNKDFTLDAVEVVGGTIFTNAVDLGFTRTILAQQNGVKGGLAANVFTDTYSVNPTWNADAGDYSGTVQYTVVQK